MSAYPAVHAYPQPQPGYAPAPVAYAQPAPVAYPQPMAYPQPVAVAPVVAYPQPIIQQVVVAPPPPVAPLFIVDSQRKSTHQPGVLVYSAKFSEMKLSCLYCIQTCPFCMDCCSNTREMSKMTHLDVYTNAVLFSKPDFFAHTCDGCCGHNSLGLVRYYDHPVFSRSVTSDGLCYGHICACFSCQGSFGEQITFMNSCCTDCVCNRSALQHFIGCCNCCGVNETIFGLKEDEGRRLAAIINEQANIFRANPNQYRLDPLVSNGVDTKFV